jgi:hypothetical protein
MRETCNLCLAERSLLHLTWWSPVPYISFPCKWQNFILLYVWLNNIPLCVYIHIYDIYGYISHFLNSFTSYRASGLFL